jgi:two-component system response regulator FixJ
MLRDDRSPRIEVVEQKLVAIVDDDEEVRHSTAHLLEIAGYRVQEYASGDAFLAAQFRGVADCVLLDLRMPGKDGLDVLRVVHGWDEMPPVLVLTGHGAVKEAVEAMKLGAADFLEKPYPPEALLQAIEAALAARAKAGPAIDHEAVAKVATLSQRQQQVLRGILRGLPNKVIAFDLGLSIRTVEAYRAQLLDKLGVRGTAEAVRMAIAAGMLAA